MLPVETYFVLRLSDSEGLTPVLDSFWKHQLVDKVVLLLRQPVHALIVIQFDAQILIYTPLTNFMRLLEMN